LDAFYIAFDLVHSDLVWFFDAVPDAKVLAVLGNNHVGVGHPAHILAIV